MADYDEFRKLLDDLTAKISHDEDDEPSVELEITAKKKKEKPASLYQLIDELIDEFNRPTFLGGGNDADSGADVSESVCKVTLAVKDYLHVSDENGERFILLPNRDGERFETGSEYHFYTKQYKSYDFLVTECSPSEFIRFLPHLDGMDKDERCAFIVRAKKDPEGFALWGNLGKAKRSAVNLPIALKSVYPERAKELLCRIPLDRNDLYNSLASALYRYQHSPGNEKADHEEVLLKKMKVISMMLLHDRNDPLNADNLASVLGKAKVTACDRVKDRAENWLPNILVVGLNYAQAITSICETGRTLNEISLGGVQGNDFLFGDEMSYYCSGCGELMSSITNGESFPSAVLFSDVDLMGTTVRSSNPLYGLASLLRRHTFHDFYMRELTIDVSDIQFICQVNRLEDCPELLLREMDIIVEL